MCRFIAYVGEPLLINNVVSRTKDSLIKQSFEALESDIVLNADGFGIGWYRPDVKPIPAVFVSILPAWNDINLLNISHLVVSPCFFGHVRAASNRNISHYNCHPFHYDRYLFMHNGSIGGFSKIKLALLNLVHPEYFNMIKGNTDSEVLFALWLSFFEKSKDPLTSMANSWRSVISTITDLQQKFKIKEHNYINALVTDGKLISGIRYSTNPKVILSLHYISGEKFVNDHTGAHMLPVNENVATKSVIISSERLTSIKEEWLDVPPQHIITVDKNKQIQCLAL